MRLNGLTYEWNNQLITWNNIQKRRETFPRVQGQSHWKSFEGKEGRVRSQISPLSSNNSVSIRFYFFILKNEEPKIRYEVTCTCLWEMLCNRKLLTGPQLQQHACFLINVEYNRWISFWARVIQSLFACMQLFTVSHVYCLVLYKLNVALFYKCILIAAGFGWVLENLHTRKNIPTVTFTSYRV